MNLTHRDDKRRHVEKLLCEHGFSNMSFPTTMDADDLDIASVFEDDLVAGACPAETNRRIAAALRPAGVAARRGRAVPGGLRRGMWGPPPRAPADPTARPG
jgi:hypothetical protein